MKESAIGRRARRLTEALVAIPSVSPSRRGEGRVVEALARFLSRARLSIEPPARTTLPDGRRNLVAVARGGGRRAVVLLGHVDTVGVEEFGAAENPFRPRSLRAPRGFLRGRGVLDMKSGLAAAAVAAAERARRGGSGSVIVCAVADEENESAGVRHAISRLAALRRRFDLVGAINLDYVMRTRRGKIPVYAGTVGKALAGVLALGLPAHAGDPLRGVDASLLLAEAIRAIDLDPRLADEGAAPPVALRFGDLMGRYNVQTPDAAVAFFNCLVTRGGLDARLDALERALRGAARSAEARLASRGVAARVAVARWSRLRGRGAPATPRASRSGDARARAAAAVLAAARAGGVRAPALVLFLAPPFYPPDDGSRSGPLLDALGRALAAGPRDVAREIEVERFYPAISDMSFLALSPLAARSLAAVEREMPIPHGLPVDAMRRLDLPAIDLGPVGAGAHERGERVETRFAFEVLPRLLGRVVDEALETKAPPSRGRPRGRGSIARVRE